MTAFLVVSIVGLLFGVLLAVCSYFFAVPEDEKVKEIRGWVFTSDESYAIMKQIMQKNQKLEFVL